MHDFKFLSIMNIEISVFIVITLLFYTCISREQGIPERCQMRDDVKFTTCCIFPPFFRGEVARKCGGMMSLSYLSSTPNVTGIRRHTLTGCAYWKCLLEEYRILVDDKFLDQESYFIHLERWVEANPEFSGTMLNAKVHCKQLFKNEMPLPVCIFYSFNSCIRNYIITDCPRLIDNPECRAVKEFYDECQEYHI